MSTVVSTDKTRPNRVLSSEKRKSFFLITFRKYYKHSWDIYKLTILPPILALGYSQFVILDIFKVKHFKHQLQFLVQGETIEYRTSIEMQHHKKNRYVRTF